MVVTWGKPAHESAIAAYHAKTLALLRHPLPYDRGEALKPLRLNMTTDARRRWIAFSDEVVAALKPGLGCTKSLALRAKSPSTRRVSRRCWRSTTGPQSNASTLTI